MSSERSSSRKITRDEANTLYSIVENEIDQVKIKIRNKYKDIMSIITDAFDNIEPLTMDTIFNKDSISASLTAEKAYKLFEDKLKPKTKRSKNTNVDLTVISSQPNELQMNVIPQTQEDITMSSQNVPTIQDNNNESKQRRDYRTEFIRYLHSILYQKIPKTYDNIKNEFLSFVLRKRNESNDKERIEKWASELEREYKSYKYKDGYGLIEPMINNFNQCLKNIKITQMGSKLAIDESLCFTACRSNFIQSMPRKPAKQGLLSYCVADSLTPFVYYIDFYRGRPLNPSDNMGPILIMKLLKETEHIWKGNESNITLFMDNYFCNTQLCCYLRKLGLNFICTMNKGRVDIPPIVKDYKEMGNGSYRVFNVSGSDIKYVQFRDYTKDVLIITSIDNTNEVIKVIRNSYTTNVLYEKEITATQKLYMLGMHGVDTLDLCNVNISMRRRALTWDNVYFEYLINMSVINIYTIVNSFNRNQVGNGSIYNLDRRSLIKTLGKELVEKYRKPFKEVEREISKLTKNITDDMDKSLYEFQLEVNKFENICNNKGIRPRCKICTKQKIEGKRARGMCVKCKRYICKYHFSVCGICYECSGFKVGDEIKTLDAARGLKYKPRYSKKKEKEEKKNPVKTIRRSQRKRIHKLIQRKRNKKNCYLFTKYVLTLDLCLTNFV